MREKYLWWFWSLCVLVLEVDPVWAALVFPWKRLEEDVKRYGVMEKMLCEHTACVVTWKDKNIAMFDGRYCNYHVKKKRVICRYIYEYV